MPRAGRPRPAAKLERVQGEGCGLHRWRPRGLWNSRMTPLRDAATRGPRASVGRPVRQLGAVKGAVIRSSRGIATGDLDIDGTITVQGQGSDLTLVIAGGRP